MLLKFIGENGSMGLIKDREYLVEVYSHNECIWVEWKPNYKCPYASPQALARNWALSNN